MDFSTTSSPAPPAARRFELYLESYAAGTADPLPLGAVARDGKGAYGHPSAGADPGPALVVDLSSSTVWAAPESAGRAIRVVEHHSDAHFGFRCVTRRVGTTRREWLAFVPLVPGLLVNALPAAPLHLVTTRDSLLLAPETIAYVTQRVTPFVGEPHGELVGRPCGFCRIPVAATSYVVTCAHCQTPYHHETAITRPDVPPEKRLECAGGVKNCLTVSCRRELSGEPRLVWSPFESEAIS